MTEEQTRKFKNTVKDEESLKLLMEGIEEFTDYFCKFMYGNTDFTLRLEANGNKGEILQVRVYTDNRKQPKGAQKRIDKKKSQKKI